VLEAPSEDVVNGGGEPSDLLFWIFILGLIFGADNQDQVSTSIARLGNLCVLSLARQISAQSMLRLSHQVIALTRPALLTPLPSRQMPGP
jgi:hypothetical protein